MDLLKRLLFRCYVAWSYLRWWFARVVADEKEAEQVLIWKDAWFFLWHVFFWGGGRWFMSHFTKVRPLEGELSPDAEKHYRLFSELASRDAKARSLDQRIIRPTHYRLSKEAAKEFCIFYAYVADIAPWQYGIEKRKVARRRMGFGALLSAGAFFVSLSPIVPDSHFFAWVSLAAFFAMIGYFAGWCASLSLYRTACEAKRIRDEEKSKK